MGEESPGEQDEDRQPAGAGHEWNDGDRDEAAFAALDGSGRHDRRHVAAEAHHHRDEGLAVKADPVHQLIDDERGARHVPGVLHYRKEEIENQYVRQEHQHTSHAGDHTVHEKILEPSVLHKVRDEIPELPHQPVDPVHRIVAQRERGLENEVKKEYEDRERGPFVRDDSVDPVGDGLPRPGFDMLGVSLGESSVDE